MALKTQPTDASVPAFLAALESEQRRTDSETLIELMREATGAEPVLWGTNIVGFGSYTYTYASGQTGDWMQVAFAPRKDRVTLYLNSLSNHTDLLERLGKHTRGGGCLHLKKLSDADPEVLRELIQRSVAATRG